MIIASRYFTSVLCTTTLFSSFYVMAADDEYMKRLEAEAENSELDRSGQRENNTVTSNSSDDMLKKDWVGECDYINDVLALGVVWEEFASHLKQCSLSTYAFYRRLDPDSQRSVYINNYSKAAPTKLSILKKAILKYF